MGPLVRAIEAKAADHGGVPREVGLLADALERFFTESVTLAKLELGQQARAAVDDGARILVSALLVFLGYGLACVALALTIAPAIGTVWAFLAVGSVNASAGSLGLFIVALRLLRPKRGRTGEAPDVSAAAS